MVNVGLVAAICALVLLVKTILTIAYQGKMQSKHGYTSPNEEDRKGSPSNGTSETLLDGGSKQPAWDVVRAKRMLGNDTENIPYALIVSVMFVAINVQRGTAFPTVLLIAYTVLRCLHSICFAFSLQPFRSLCFALSFAVVLAMTIAIAVNGMRQGTAARVVAVALVTLILDVKLHLLVWSIGPLRTKLGAATLPDDEKVLKAAVKSGDEYPELLQRIDRCHMNDVENLPLGFLAMYYFLMVAPEHALVTVVVIVFGAARLLHTVAYLKGLQPWRTIFFFLGQVAVITMLVWSVVRTFDLTVAHKYYTPMRVFSVVFLVLYLKMFFLAILTAKRRGDSGVVVTAEDAALVPNGAVRQKNEMPDEVARVMRAHQNDLENIPLFLYFAALFSLRFLFVAFFPLTTDYGGHAIAGDILMIAFAVLRILHTVCYLNKLPRRRRFKPRTTLSISRRCKPPTSSS